MFIKCVFINRGGKLVRDEHTDCYNHESFDVEEEGYINLSLVTEVIPYYPRHCCVKLVGNDHFTKLKMFINTAFPECVRRP